MRSNEHSNQQIYAHFSQQNWKSIRTWATFEFHHVSRFRNKKNSTALHLAFLFMAPIDVVDALLYAAPELASVATNDDGELPIHWALRVGTPMETLRKLVKVYPKGGITANRYGMTPLSILWDRHCYDFVEIFKACHTIKTASVSNSTLSSSLSSSTSTSSSSSSETTDTHVTQHYEKDPNVFFEVGNMMHSISDEQISEHLHNDTRATIQRKKYTWQKIIFLLQAFHQQEITSINDHDDESSSFPCKKKTSRKKHRNHHEDGVKDTNTFRPLHCAVASPVPLAFTAFLYPLNPHHLHEKNQMGRLPLSIAVSSLDLNDHPEIFVPLIKHLMYLDPRAVSTQDWTGKLPLVLAIESGKSWENGISALLKAEPRALSTRDELSRMYPFMLASVKEYTVSKNEDDKDEYDFVEMNKLDLTYMLLRESPECVRIGIPNSKR